MNASHSIINLLLYRLGIYLLAVAVAYILATVSATQSVVSSLGSMGIEVGAGDRLAMTLKDLTGMAGLFLPMVAFALLFALLAAALLCHWWRRLRLPLYLLAGATGMVTIHLTLNLAFGITPVAIARTPSGLISQAVAGAIGAYVYIFLLDRRQSGQSAAP